jgi:hypothetical protein
MPDTSLVSALQFSFSTGFVAAWAVTLLLVRHRRR